MRVGQGRKPKQFLRDNPDLADEIETKLRELLGLPAPARPPPMEEAVAGPRSRCGPGGR